MGPRAGAAQAAGRELRPHRVMLQRLICDDPAPASRLPMRHAAAALTLSLALAACGQEDLPLPDAATVNEPIRVGTVEGLRVPESALHDAARDVWYVSNIVGGPSDLDGNGVITRISGDLATVDTLFIAGGSNGVTLNGPKGMALVADTLWVADIDHLRGFDVTTGAPVVSIPVPGAVFLNDCTPALDDALFCTDTGIRSTAEGMTHPGPDRVWRIAGRTVREALRFDAPVGPNGIALDVERASYLIVPMGAVALYRWDPVTGVADSIAAGPGGYDGVVLLGDGRALVSSWTDSTVHVLDGGTLTPMLRGLPAPADLGVDRTRGRVAVPLFDLGRVEFWTIPQR
jgi:sugar lactone lactonase YvrE